MDVTVMDLSGKIIKKLYTGKARKNLVWDGKDNRDFHVASGLYFIRCKLGTRSISLHALIVR